MTEHPSTIQHLFGTTPTRLVAAMAIQNVPISLVDAQRLLTQVLGNGKTDFEYKNPLKLDVRNRILQTFSLAKLKILERIEDSVDKSVRYLFEAPDGVVFEAVRIPLAKPNHFSVCLSSQAGCAMGCDFCATGRLGLKRNLEAWEIIAQFWQIREETEGQFTGAVFMGQGEPFHNYDAVILAAKILSSTSGCRLCAENITISTVGLVPQIRRYTAEGHVYRLIVSLTSAIPEKRMRMLPVAAKWSVEDVIAALKEHAEKIKTRVTVAWVLIRGFNSGIDEVEALKRLLEGVPIKLNLIDVNDARADGYKRASEDERQAFYQMLQDMHVPIVRRYSVGNSSHSACGMLAGRRLAEINPN